MTVVQLRPAFEWTCEECGRDQFGRPVAADSPTDLARLRELLGDEWFDKYAQQEGEWMLAPTTVICCFCGARFQAEWSN